MHESSTKKSPAMFCGNRRVRSAMRAPTNSHNICLEVELTLLPLTRHGRKLGLLTINSLLEEVVHEKEHSILLSSQFGGAGDHTFRGMPWRRRRHQNWRR